eukprot:6190342-Pleurochrysis_carterae.AAC.5
MSLTSTIHLVVSATATRPRKWREGRLQCTLTRHDRKRNGQQPQQALQHDVHNGASHAALSQPSYQVYSYTGYTRLCDILIKLHYDNTAVLSSFSQLHHRSIKTSKPTYCKKHNCLKNTANAFDLSLFWDRLLTCPPREKDALARCREQRKTGQGDS